MNMCPVVSPPFKASLLSHIPFYHTNLVIQWYYVLILSQQRRPNFELDLPSVDDNVKYCVGIVA